MVLQFFNENDWSFGRDVLSDQFMKNRYWGLGMCPRAPFPGIHLASRKMILSLV